MQVAVGHAIAFEEGAQLSHILYVCTYIYTYNTLLPNSSLFFSRCFFCWYLWPLELTEWFFSLSLSTSLLPHRYRCPCNVTPFFVSPLNQLAGRYNDTYTVSIVPLVSHPLLTVANSCRSSSSPIRVGPIPPLCTFFPAGMPRKHPRKDERRQLPSIAHRHRSPVQRYIAAVPTDRQFAPPRSLHSGTRGLLPCNVFFFNSNEFCCTYLRRVDPPRVRKEADPFAGYFGEGSAWLVMRIGAAARGVRAGREI